MNRPTSSNPTPEKPAIAPSGTFHIHENNGVTAVVTDATWQVMRTISAFRATLRGRHLLDPTNAVVVPGPIFTFSDSSSIKEFVTGTTRLYATLRSSFRDQGYLFVEESSGLYVPFSNGREHGVLGATVSQIEHTYRTTAAEFIEAFPGFNPQAT